MVRILYGVAGEGMGHAMRSLAIIEHLGKKHRIKVVSASRSFAVLSKRFDCEEIDYFKIIYRNNTAANILTVLNNMVRFPLIFFKGLKVGRIIDSFKPDVILTDFEPIVDYYAAMRGIPVISIDNQHIISEASHGRVDQGHAVDKFITSCIIKTFVIKANKKIITTFFEPALKKGSNAILVAPILRKEIAKLKPRVGKHVLVYQTSTSNTALLDVLRQLPHSFVVYGFGKKEKQGHIEFKDSKDEQEFFKDLASCKAVITNGGFTLMTEALYLHKPILSFPVRRQFEQILNALYLHTMGFGVCAKKTNKKTIVEFLNNLKLYREKVKTYRRYDLGEPLREIEKVLKSLS